MFETKPYPKIWLAVHMILDVALGVLIFNPTMVITFIFTTLLIVAALALDSYIHVN